jgi:cellulose synthase/poly-beta-1,6-N-acetylglucosamine synthase-like glycosyltransferase
MMATWPAIVAVGLTLLTLGGTIELALLTFAGILPARAPRRKSRDAVAKIAQLAIVVPAHNEAAVISRCVQSVAGLMPLDGLATVIAVVADNCADDTAKLARAAGARVMVRVDTEHRGKGFALQYAFEQLLREGYDAVLVVDADTLIDPNALREIVPMLEAGADGVQTKYSVLNESASLRARLMNVAFMAFNVLRPRGRERLGLSVGIVGNGFALSRATLAAVPYDAHSIVEDLEYHLRVVRSGRRIAFAGNTAVRSAMPSGGSGARAQRARWEGGRLSMIRQNVPSLAREVAAGDWKLLEPLLELLLWPLAFYVSLLLLTLAIPFGPTRSYAMVALVLVVLHVSCAIVTGGGGVRDFAALIAVPFYLIWKLVTAPAILRSARRAAPWVRTAREG